MCVVVVVGGVAKLKEAEMNLINQNQKRTLQNTKPLRSAELW